MAKSPYIRDVLSEQNLVEDLYAETINHMGRDVYYIPRTLRSQDKIFGEDSRSIFSKAYLIDMYLSNVQGFEGAGDIITKFGIEVKDRATLIVAKRTFSQLVTSRDSTIVRPREGDLIYFPLSSTLFEINFVEHENPLYQLGDLYSFVLFAEAFSYNNEVFQTGITDIDGFYSTRKKLAQTISLSEWTESSGTTSNFFVGEEIFQVSGHTGADISYAQATGKAEIIDISGTTMTIGNVDGTFAVTDVHGFSASILGRGSTAEKYISGTADSDFSTQINVQSDELLGDNEEIDIELDRDDLLDFSEQDPFSEGNF
jgi:hypothetical protein